MPDPFVTIETVASRREAEAIKSLLSAEGIECMLSQEAAGPAYGLSESALGAVHIRVPTGKGGKARRLVEDYLARRRAERGRGE